MVFGQAFEAAERRDWTTVARLYKEITRFSDLLVTGGSTGFRVLDAAFLMGSGSGKALSPLEPVGVQQRQEDQSFCAKHAT